MRNEICINCESNTYKRVGLKQIGYFPFKKPNIKNLIVRLLLSFKSPQFMLNE
jgi:hypothetical protein